MVSVTFFILGIIMFPLLQMFRGTFKQSTQAFISPTTNILLFLESSCIVVQARICMLEQLHSNEESMKGRIISLVYPCLAEIFNQYFSRKVLSYLNGICPTKKMSCIGKYRRNLIFLEETSRYLSYWAGYAILDGSITMVAMTSKLASPTLLFWIHNILAFAFIDVFYGLYVPLNMKLPSEKVLYHGPRFQLITASKGLEPRRYLEVGWREETGSVEPSTPPTSPLTLPSKFTTVSGLTVWQVIKFENATSTIIDTIYSTNHLDFFIS